ncbi:vesicle-trafficking protein SEC22a [Hyalella azteca]|uniref:Vesicle-trafficking protein SEC22a n=1 Tax=Hyalella azteca TaxID=294128 RepID=A0A8B7PA15_HYAAZ|nr:vesicle-trafficking protein SEC22a [Hyalella azteca]
MIHFSTVIRISDGIPLSVTRDSSIDSSFAAAKKNIKLLVTKIMLHPKRVCLLEDMYTIHCVHSSVVAFIAVCDPTFSHLLIHSFLDELDKEFSMLYNSSVIAAVRRPYAFTEFDSYMEKMQQKYCSPQFVASRGNLTDLRAELSISPPITLSVADISPPSPAQQHPNSPNHVSLGIHGISNGTLSNNKHSADIAQVGASKQLMPLSLAARGLISLAVLFSTLDAYRGLSSLSQGGLEEFDGKSPLLGFGFLLECSILGSQVHVLRRYQRFRKLWSLASVVLVALVSLLLLSDRRDAWLSLLYVAVSAALAYFTLNRNFRKLNKFNV